MIHQGPSSRQPAPGRSIQGNTPSAALQQAAVPAQLQTPAEKDMPPVQWKFQSAGQPGPFILQQQPQVTKPIPEKFTLQATGEIPVQRKLIDKDFPELTKKGLYGKNQQIDVHELPQKKIIYPLNLYETSIAPASSYEELARMEAEKIAEIGEKASSEAITPVAKPTDNNPEYSQQEENPLAITGRGASGRSQRGGRDGQRGAKKTKKRGAKKENISSADDGPAPQIVVGYKTSDPEHYWPFALRIKGSWEEENEEEKELNEDDGTGIRNIEVTFSTSGYGYTQKVEDGRHSFIAKPEEEEEGVNGFSMKHKYDESVNLSARAKALENSADADATSKVISEGARWISVRNKAEEGNLKDNTRFYPDGYYPDNFAPPSVTFKTLWNSWNAVFEKAWNISEEALIKKLESRELTEDVQPKYSDLKANASNYKIPRATAAEKTDIDQFLNGPLKDTWEKAIFAIRVNVSRDVQDDQDGHTKLDHYGRFVTIYKEILEQDDEQGLDDEQDVDDEQTEERFNKGNFFYTLTHELALHAIPNQGKNLDVHGMFDGSSHNAIAIAVKDHNAIIEPTDSYFKNTIEPAAKSLAANEVAIEGKNKNFPTCDDFLSEFLVDVSTVTSAIRGNFILEKLGVENAIPNPNEQYETPENVAALKGLLTKALLTIGQVRTLCDELEVNTETTANMIDVLTEALTPMTLLEDDADDQTVLVAIMEEAQEENGENDSVKDDATDSGNDTGTDDDDEEETPTGAYSNPFAALQNDDDDGSD